MPEPAPSPSNPPSLADRVQRLEENQAFAEHAGERVQEQVRELERQVREMARRLVMIEKQLREAATEEKEEPE